MTVDNTVSPFGADPLPQGEFPFEDVSYVEEVDVNFPIANDTESDYVEIEP